jgi:spermidine synthase
MKTTVVEINPSVIDACRMWFHLPPDGEKLRVLQADAEKWVVASENQNGTDLLQIDLYDHNAAAPVLDSFAFYANCFSVLTDGGVMSVNLFGEKASFARSLSRIQRAFGAHRVGSLQPCPEGNTIVLAVKAAAWPDRETLLARAQSLQARFALSAPRWVKLLKVPPVDIFSINDPRIAGS